MTITDELERLQRLYTSGALSQAEYEAAKARVLGGAGGGSSGGDSSLPAAIQRLRLSNNDKWIAGVCGGIAALTGVEAWIWRLVFVLGLLANGVTALLYLVLWIFVPRE